MNMNELTIQASHAGCDHPGCGTKDSDGPGCSLPSNPAEMWKRNPSDYLPRIEATHAGCSHPGCSIPSGRSFVFGA